MVDFSVEAQIERVEAIKTYVDSLVNADGVKKIDQPIQVVRGEAVTLVSANTYLSTFYGVEIDSLHYRRAVFFLNVTQVAGTSPTLDVIIQTQDPVSGEWFELVRFSQVTDVSSQRLVLSPDEILGFKLRAYCVLGGDTPSFTFSVGGVLVQ